MSWGPFVPDLDEPERRARFRALRAIIRVMCGGHAEAALAALKAAEQEPGDETSAEALAKFNELPTLAQRHVLSVYVRL